MGRGGYVLLGVLWLTAGITMLGALLSVAVRDAVSTSRNRVALVEAEWGAEECLAWARGLIQERVDGAASTRGASTAEVWSRIDQILRDSPVPPPAACQVSAVGVGSRLDVNRVDEAFLAGVLHADGFSEGDADSIASVLVERRRERPFRHIGELDRLEGAPEASALQHLLDVDPAPLSVNHLAPAVLSMLPGFTDETVRAVASRSSREPPFGTFLEMAVGVSPTSREALVRAIPRLANEVTFVPSAWNVRADASSGSPAVTVRLEVRLERLGTRVYIARRRMWIP